MRSLLIPAGIIACGLLAALPFRRSTNEPSTAAPLAMVDEIAGLPATVTPLREMPVAGSWSPTPKDSPSVVGRFASVTAPTENPYSAAPEAPLAESLATSYQEVAIPLALPTDPDNLLAPPEPTESLRRFGIPDSLLAAESPAASPEVAERRVGAEGWAPEQAIPLVESQSALASVLEPAADPQSQGPFQTVSETRVTAAEPAPRQRMFIREPQ